MTHTLRLNNKYNTSCRAVNPLRQGWVNLLSRYKWDWFTTLTFRDIPRTYTAINRAKQFLRAIEGKEKRKVGYYLAMELNRSGTPHFHALMGNLDGVRRLTWMDRWEYGYARIYPYEVDKGANYYITKYVVKENYQSSGWVDIQNLECLNQLTLDLY